MIISCVPSTDQTVHIHDDKPAGGAAFDKKKSEGLEIKKRRGEGGEMQDGRSEPESMKAEAR